MNKSKTNLSKDSVFEQVITTKPYCMNIKANVTVNINDASIIW